MTSSGTYLFYYYYNSLLTMPYQVKSHQMVENAAACPIFGIFCFWVVCHILVTVISQEYLVIFLLSA